MSSKTNKLYANTTKIDNATGLPENYESLVAKYTNLVRANAAKAGIPDQDIEDATQEIHLKFWTKNGLDFFDPSLNKKFASLYHGWTSLFLLQERDKSFKNSNRNQLVPHALASQRDLPDFSTEVAEIDVVVVWVRRAEKALCELGKAHLVPLLHRCLEAAELNTVVTRADVVEATGVSLRKATATLQELRSALTSVGMGADSIQNISDD